MAGDGFDVTAIGCPVIVLHGRADTGVPIANALHTATIVPGAELRTFDHHGHFSIVTEVPAALRDLLLSTIPAQPERSQS